MRFAGIDIAHRTHVVAVVDEASTLVLKSTSITDNAAGYEKLVALIGPPADILVVMEATGHYWRNLFAYLERSLRFCEEKLPLGKELTERIIPIEDGDIRQTTIKLHDAQAALLALMKHHGLLKHDPKGEAPKTQREPDEMFAAEIRGVKGARGGRCDRRSLGEVLRRRARAGRSEERRSGRLTWESARATRWLRRSWGKPPDTLTGSDGGAPAIRIAAWPPPSPAPSEPWASSAC